MNILLDLIPFQYLGGVGGAASFTKRVCDEVIKRRKPGVTLFALVDSSLPEGRQYNYKDYVRQYGLTIADRAKTPLSTLIAQNSIDTFFIAMAQFHEESDLDGVKCKTIMFIHDIFDVERNDSLIDLMLFKDSKYSRWYSFKRFFCLVTGRWHKAAKRRYARLMPLYSAPSTIPYTVSEYTRSSLLYYFPELKDNPPRVCYSPLKETKVSTNIENEKLRGLVASGEPFLLFLAADREYKNVELMLKVFPRLRRDYPTLHLLTLKLGRTICPEHIDIDFLSDSDLEQAYSNARALVFPSFFEGFGYPPVEAMRYGTPSVVANVTSIPEVMEQAAEYFSPFYPADLYRALRQVLDHREQYSQRMSERWTQLRSVQEEQLRRLIEEIYREVNP